MYYICIVFVISSCNIVYVLYLYCIFNIIIQYCRCIIFVKNYIRVLYNQVTLVDFVTSSLQQFGFIFSCFVHVIL